MRGPGFPLMPGLSSSEAKSHYLHSGTIFASAEPHVITTVLGTCVSVCLWDKRRLIGGMNHFLLPRWDGENRESPEFGDIAIPELLKALDELQCSRAHVVAKVFGGKYVQRGTGAVPEIGKDNARIALEMLGRERIPVVAKDVGGGFGRRLVFNTATGEVLVKRFVTA